MQKFITSDDFQDQMKCRIRRVKEANVPKPSAEVIRNILAYAAALHVFKTKSMGNRHILMN